MYKIQKPEGNTIGVIKNIYNKNESNAK